MSETATNTADLAALVAALGAMAPALDDADRIDRVRLLEQVKSVAAAAQAIETRDFVASQKAAQAVAGVPAARQGRGVAAQVALARRISPWQAQRYTGWAAILTRELPATFAQLQGGRISEWRAMLVARETIFLSREDRAVVDAELAPRLEGWGDRQVEAETKRIAYRLDPRGFLDRSRAAANDRRVTMRPAPDTMARLTALLPVAQAVACYAALGKTADLTAAGGDERGRGQIMADTLVQRVTGQATAEAVPIEIELIMTDTTLFGHPTSQTDEASNGGEGGADEPGLLIGFGPIPADLARELALGSAATDIARRRIRRLFVQPTTGQFAAMESQARLFTANERRFIRYRDHGTCRTPWCGAPIRHADHVKPHGQGGPTRVDNGQGQCEGCNYAREATGWRGHVKPDGSITTRTPTGHHYRSRLPTPPGLRPRPRPAVLFASQVRVIDVVYHSEHVHSAA